MQTRLADFIRDTADGAEAEAILRKCVHCGFCTATCPTFQLLGDELDSPRGRIYLIKQMLEGEPVSARTRLHLDRCLSCRSCETTCPSGVEYGRLVDIGRKWAETLAPPRAAPEAAKRWLLANAVSKPAVFGFAYRAGQRLRPLLPKVLAAKVAAPQSPGTWPAPRHSRKWLVLGGCAQPALLPGVNAAAARVLDRIGISLIAVRNDGCCGALRFHLNDHDGGRADAAGLLARWLPAIERGEVEGVVVTASGCGSFIREYAHLFRDDASLNGAAARVTERVLDISELLVRHFEAITAVMQTVSEPPKRLAFHSPCSLQHGLKIRGVAERLLVAAGYELTPVADAHLCCGSAGSYSILQPEISERLRDNKLRDLAAGMPCGIASANVGCIAHLASGANTPVRHWVEWLSDQLDQ
ncbi:glycolate oxidase subunit GlcF [Niveibacterium umoris]|uniref:Glycolate oxidase iron-sulfur subunit n=1 Tax=Niveibacterium umoris TaxID=1193620 RepID=A0A840BK44_9RHOO|nr:glycolate oxidase subunit GlcF [Niveibacterium umoris]MBB4011266.1 glycolate oxidase iron-sulfur subunit [Niveibacterium umoris]